MKSGRIVARESMYFFFHFLKMLFRSSNIWNFIYLLQIYSIYGNIKSAKSDQLPVGLIAQLVRSLHRYRSSHKFESRWSLHFLQALFSQLLKLSV